MSVNGSKVSTKGSGRGRGKRPNGGPVEDTVSCAKPCHESR